MEYAYRTSGTCSKEIRFEITDNRVTNISFVGGCNGNLKGLAILAEGLSPDQIAEKLSGITCGFKRTSCPDQLAKAVKEAARG